MSEQINLERKQSSRKLLMVFLAVLCVVGIGLRFWISWFSVGSNDIVNWFHSAHTIRAKGLVESYRIDEYLNNPPGISLLVANLLDFGELVNLPFPFLHRGIGILGEMLCVVLLIITGYKQQRPLHGFLMGAVFALNPLSMLVSGYHGHTDGICGVLAFLAFFIWVHWREGFWAGIFLGASMNVKLIPLLLCPALLLSMETWQQRLLCLLGLGVSCSSFVVMWLYGGSDFYSRVFGYRSILDYWGIQTFLLIGQTNYPAYSEVFKYISTGFQSIGPYLILGAVSILNLFFKRNAFERAAVSYALFAVLAPGFGITYPAMFMPFFCVVSLWWGAIYSIVNGLALLAVYKHFLVSSWPFQTVHLGSSPPAAVLAMFVMWAMLLWFSVGAIVRYWKEYAREEGVV
jgi:hypothetical protein